MVTAGVAWLDAHHPGWRSKVDVARLDFGDAAHTLLTQVVPVPAYRGSKPPKFGYDVVFKHAKAAADDPFEWLTAHGFLGDPGLLKEGWLAVLHSSDS